MSLGSIFKDLYDRITAKSRKDTLEHARNDGGTLGSTPAGYGGSFEPIHHDAPAGDQHEHVPPPGTTNAP